MKQINEQNAIDALLEIIPFFTGKQYVILHSPDDGNSKKKDVDYIIESKSESCPKIVVEHTIVESFRGQISYVRKSYKLVEQINEKCKSNLPQDKCFTLVIPPNLSEQLQRLSIITFQDEIIPWIINASKILDENQSEDFIYDGTRVLLICNGSIPEINGNIGRIPQRPKDVELLAIKNLWISIQHGLGKIEDYKKQGYESILILENVSGEVHPDMLEKIMEDTEVKNKIDLFIDYIIEFVSNENRMIVGNLWKEKKQVYKIVPYNRRFQKNDGKWVPIG